jgi:hypothetical protein
VGLHLCASSSWTSTGFFKPTPNPRKVPYIIAALERLTALQQGIRRRDTGIVEICRASPVHGPQAPTRRSPAFTPALGSGTPTVSSGGQLVAGIQLVGGELLHHFGRAIGVIIVSRIAQRRRK